MNIYKKNIKKEGIKMNIKLFFCFFIILAFSFGLIVSIEYMINNDFSYIKDELGELKDSIYAYTHKNYDLVKIRNSFKENENFVEVLLLNINFMLVMINNNFYIFDKKQNKTLYSIHAFQNKKKDIITKRSFKCCGRFQNDFWMLFKEAYVEQKNNSDYITQMKMKQTEAYIASQLEENQKSTTINKTDFQLLEEMLSSFLIFVKESNISNECLKSSENKCVLIKQIEDEKIMHKILNYYLPELIEIIKCYIQSKKNNDTEVANCCKNTLLSFENRLKIYCNENKSEEDKFEVKSRCKFNNIR